MQIYYYADFEICEENVVPGIKMEDTFSGTKWYMTYEVCYIARFDY